MPGYRPLISSDAEEQALREAWHKAKEVAETPSPSNTMAFLKADKALTDFLWKRASAIVAKDREKHPNAKRNLPVGAEGSNKTRALP